MGLFREGNFTFKNKNVTPSILPSKSIKINNLKVVKLLSNYDPNVEFWRVGRKERKGSGKGKKIRELQ